MARKGKASQDHAAKRCVIINKHGKPHIHMGKIAIFRSEPVAIDFAERNVTGYLEIRPAKLIDLT